MASTEPKRTVPMVAQFIVRIGMHEHVKRSVIQRQPTYDVGKLRRPKRDLVAPSWVGSDLPLVKAAHLNPIAKLRCHNFTKFPGGITTGGVEIHVCMPARDTRCIETRHYGPFRSRASPVRHSAFKLGSTPVIVISSGTPWVHCKGPSGVRLDSIRDP